MNNKKFVFVQNIVAPYRTFLYNKMATKGVDITVFYQSLTEKDRNWKVDLSELKHPYWIDNHGIYLYVKGFHFHHNPLMIWKILSLNRNYYVQLPGWACIDSIILCILKKMHLVRCHFNSVCEANYLSKDGPVPQSNFKKVVRKLFMSSMDGYTIIPGKMPILALHYFGIDTSKLKFVIMPNVIQDDHIYNKRDNKENNLPIFIISARLIEKIKGILNFWKAIGIDNIKKCEFWVVGDGVDKGLYEKYIQENDLGANIKMLGFKNMEEMNDLYNQADALLLPSFYDPSPLTLVEATKVGLPILASNHCGNHFECVMPGENGETFDPCNHNDIKNKFELFLSEKNKWRLFSKKSEEIYSSKLSSDVVIENFKNQTS